MPLVSWRHARPSFAGLFAVAWRAALAQAQPDEKSSRGLTCIDGANMIALRFDCRGGATLSQLEGPHVGSFPDLNVPAGQFAS